MVYIHFNFPYLFTCISPAYIEQELHLFSDHAPHFRAGRPIDSIMSGCGGSVVLWGIGNLVHVDVVVSIEDGISEDCQEECGCR